MSRARSCRCHPAAVLSASTERRHRPSAPEMSSGSAPTSATDKERAATRGWSTRPPLWAPPTGPKKSWKRSIARPPARAVRAFSDTQEAALALSPEQQRAKEAFVRGHGACMAPEVLEIVRTTGLHGAAMAAPMLAAALAKAG